MELLPLLARPRILVVDDDPDMVFLIERILAAAGYEDVASTTDPRRAAALYDAFGPDLVLLDHHMPGLDGLEVLAQLQDLEGARFVPMVMLTGDRSPEVKLRALEAGARDFLTKPPEEAETRLRIHNLLEMRRLHVELMRQNQVLEERVAERTRELEQAKLETLEKLARAAEFRDDQTGQHAQRVGRMCAMLGLKLKLPPRQVELIRIAAPLHDVGKIAIPDHILLKRGGLGSKEWQIMKGHTRVGARILSNSISPTLQLAEEIALTHHERWDGAGYEGLSESEIPLPGRLLALADAFDAMTHERPYRSACSVEEAIEEIERCRGSHFDPEVVDAFLEAAEEGEIPAAGLLSA